MSLLHPPHLLFPGYFEPGPDLDSLVHSGRCSPTVSLLMDKVQSDKSLLLCVCVSLHQPHESALLFERFAAKQI